MLQKKYYDAAKSKKADPEFRFFYENKKGNVSSQIRALTKVPPGAKTILLDLDDEGSYYHATKEGAVSELLDAFKANLLKKEKVQR